MDSRFFSQKDPRWAHLTRYHAKTADALQDIDEHIFDGILKQPGKVDYPLVWEAYGRFTAGIVDLLKQGLKETRRDGYTLFNYGCWDCSISMIVDQLDGCFYAYRSDIGLDPIPPNFIHALRSWQVLSVIGFNYDIVIDPVSLVTKSRVQMVLHEDYGVDGVPVKESGMLMYALDCNQQLGISVCVLGHSSLGDKEDTHWIVAYDGEQGLMMRDPSLLAPTNFSYRKVYEVCVYCRDDDVTSVIGIKQDAGFYVIFTRVITSIQRKNKWFSDLEVCDDSTF